MPDAHTPGDRTPAQRQADHASLARLSDTLVPALVAKLTGSGLGELEVREGDWSVRVRRPPGGPAAAPVRRSERPRMGSHGHAEQRPASQPRPSASAGGDAPPDPHRAIATSPAVGVVRFGPAIGTRVRAGDRIATVDLLGIPQDVGAPIDGTLVELFVQEGDAVEYGEDIGAVEADPAAGASPATDGSEAPSAGPGGEA